MNKMSNQFGNSKGIALDWINSFLSPNLAKWCPYVVCIWIKWLTKLFFLDAVYGCRYRDSDTNVPTTAIKAECFLTCSSFYLDVDTDRNTWHKLWIIQWRIKDLTLRGSWICQGGWGRGLKKLLAADGYGISYCILRMFWWYYYKELDLNWGNLAFEA